MDIASIAIDTSIYTFLGVIMLSVIVPTMWQFEPFCRFLEHVVELPVVDEVIIINNYVEGTPSDEVLKHPKVKMHNMPENIYCNPAWNLGAKLAKNENLCFLSDDVIVDLKVFSMGDKFLKPDMGMIAIQMWKDFYDLQKKSPDDPNLKMVIEKDERYKLYQTGDIEIKPWVGIPYLLGFGAFFFIPKSSWVDIHPELKVMYGDNWTFNSQLSLGRMNYLIHNCFFYSPWCATWTSELMRAKINSFVEYESHAFYMQLIEETMASYKKT